MKREAIRMRPRWTPWDKPVHEISADDVLGLKERAVSESYFVEYKDRWEPKKIARAVASFANTEGGMVVIGVEEKNLIPVAVEGVVFSGNLLESLDQAVRDNVSPLPMYSSAVVDLPNRRQCLLVEVPVGYDTPYIMVETGLILERSNTSSSPVPPQNRERIRELFNRGEAGFDWAINVIGNLQGLPHHLVIATVPQVAGGLPLHSVLYSPKFAEGVEMRSPVPFAHSSWSPRVETPGFELIIKKELTYRCTTSMRMDGVIQTGWTLAGEDEVIQPRSDLPAIVRPTEDNFSLGDVLSGIGTILAGHKDLLHDLSGYTGPTVVRVKARYDGRADSGFAQLAHVLVTHLSEQSFADRICRDLKRSFGFTILEPE